MLVRWLSSTLALMMATAVAIGCSITGSLSEVNAVGDEMDVATTSSSAPSTTNSPSPTTTVSPAPTAPPTSNSTTTTEPAPRFGGLVPSLPEGPTIGFEEWSFPLPGPSRAGRPAEVEDYPWTAFQFHARLDDQTVSYADLIDYLETVPVEHGWEIKPLAYGPEYEFDETLWNYLHPDGLWVTIELIDPPAFDDGVLPVLVVTFTIADGP